MPIVCTDCNQKFNSIINCQKHLEFNGTCPSIYVHVCECYASFYCDEFLQIHMKTCPSYTGKKRRQTTKFDSKPKASYRYVRNEDRHKLFDDQHGKCNNFPDSGLLGLNHLFYFRSIILD